MVMRDILIPQPPDIGRIGRRFNVQKKYLQVVASMFVGGGQIETGCTHLATGADTRFPSVHLLVPSLPFNPHHRRTPKCIVLEASVCPSTPLPHLAY